MSEPINVFQQTRKHLKTGNLTFLSKQVAVWQQLTKLIQPCLPSEGKWQVVCYESGVLTIIGDNQALVSQVAYLQKQFTQQLSQIPQLHDLQKLQVRLKTLSPNSPTPDKTSRALQPETQELLRSAAEFVNDPKLSQAMLRLASNKK